MKLRTEEAACQHQSSKVLKSGIWYTVSNYFVKGIGILTLPIFTRLLSTGQFGYFNNFTAWQGILLIIVTLNLESTLISARYDYQNFDSYISSVLVLSSFSAGVWMAVLNIFSGFIEKVLGMEMFYINCMLVYMFFYPAMSLFQNRERYLYHYKATIAISLLVSVITVILSVILVFSLEDKLKGRILGSVLPTVIVGMILYVILLVKGKKVDFSAWKYALPVCMPYIPHLLSLTILGSTDRIMITKFCGSTDTALYSLAYSCGSLVSLLVTSINSAFAPWLGEKLNQKEYAGIRRITPIYVGGFCALAVIIMLLSPEILLILGGRRYTEAKYVMMPVALGCVCQFIYSMYVNVEQFKKKTVPMALASASAAVLNLVLNYLFIPAFGYVAAAYTTLISYLWLLLIHMIIVYWMKLDKVYDTKFIIIAVVMMAFITLVISILYKHNIVRYIVLGIYVSYIIILLCKNKDSIYRLFKKIKS